MAIRRLTIHVAVADADPERVPTPAECIAALGLQTWDLARASARPRSGQYLVGYSCDGGRNGAERAADETAHAADASHKGRPMGDEPEHGAGGPP